MRFFLGFLLLAAIVIGVAWWREWITFGVSKNEGDTDIHVGVHPGKVKEDFKGKADKIDEHQLKGKLSSIQPDKKLAIVRHEGGDLTVAVNAETAIRIGDTPGTMADLRPGMQVTVTYVTQDKRSVAKSIVAAST